MFARARGLEPPHQPSRGGLSLSSAGAAPITVHW
jgi:hypothetical protein